MSDYNPSQFPLFCVIPESDKLEPPFNQRTVLDRLGFEAVESKVMKLFANGLVSIEAVQKMEDSTPVRLRRPLVGDLSQLWSEARDGDGQLSQTTRTLVATGTPVVSEPPRPAPTTQVHPAQEPTPVTVTPVLDQTLAALPLAPVPEATSPTLDVGSEPDLEDEPGDEPEDESDKTSEGKKGKGKKGRK